MVKDPDGFAKDSARWVIFPRLSYQNHLKIEERNVMLAEDFSSYERNKIIRPAKASGGSGSPKYLPDDISGGPCGVPAESLHAPRRGIAAGGISFTYVMESLKTAGSVPLLKIATPHPFPERLALEFLEGLDEVLCIEELDPVIERELTYLCGKYHLPAKICGKLSHHVKNAGENTRDSVSEDIRSFLAQEERRAVPAAAAASDNPPNLPVRPPVLCAGCPHRASFYAVKTAMKGKKTIFCGDIGCYTLGNAMPLDMVDTCLCMGAGLGIAQGVGHIEPDTHCFVFVGDSTFFAPP